MEEQALLKARKQIEIFDDSDSEEEPDK